MAWNQFSYEAIAERDRVRALIAHHKSKAFDSWRFESYKAQALGELARRQVAEEALSDARATLSRLDDIIDILNDMGTACPESLKPFQTVR